MVAIFANAGQCSLSLSDLWILTPTLTDPITYFCSILGVVRAGFTVFPVSHRNSPEAVAHLLTRTKAQALLTTQDHGIQQVVEKALNDMRGDKVPVPTVHNMPTFGTLFPSDRAAVTPYIPAKAWAIDEIQFIIHSSGMSRSLGQIDF